MRTKSPSPKAPAERVLKDIRRATRKHYSAEDKIRIVLDGLRGEDSIAELCRREGIAQSMYYVWSKEFLEAGKRRLAGDTARAATTDEVKGLRRRLLCPHRPIWIGQRQCSSLNHAGTKYPAGQAWRAASCVSLQPSNRDKYSTQSRQRNCGSRERGNADGEDLERGPQ